MADKISTFNHKVAGHTFKVKVEPIKDGLWTRWTAVALCPICKEELNVGWSGRIQKEREIKSTIKANANSHLRRVHKVKT